MIRLSYGPHSNLLNGLLNTHLNLMLTLISSPPCPLQYAQAISLIVFGGGHATTLPKCQLVIEGKKHSLYFSSSPCVIQIQSRFTHSLIRRG